MRIIAGEMGGRRLVAPKGDTTRPTTDRVREALMSMLASRELLVGARVLDLYAGSGALALEALSRGAEEAVCVDKGAGPRRAISANIRSLGLDERCQLLPVDATKALRQLSQEDRRFSLVFADPPYAQVQETWKLLASLGERALLDAEATVVVEHSSKGDAPQHLGPLELTDRRCYGDCALALYEMTSREASGGTHEDC